MSLPIIFFHYSDAPYLKYALKQAKYYNPGSEVYLLGDKKNNKYPFVKHIAASSLEAATQRFRAVYKHRSKNSENYELTCFLRWFYIRAFCEANNIEGFIYLDSDVLCFQNFAELLPMLGDARIANTGDNQGMPAFTYFRDRQVIDDFCDYLIYSYTDKTAIARLEALYQPFLDDPQLLGGISDMALFNFYFQDKPEGTLKVDVVNNELAVDTNINVPDGYETEDGIKKVYWRNRLPYIKKAESGKFFRCITLHYQGNAKDTMRRHYTAGGYRLAKYLETKDIKGKIKRQKNDQE